MKKKFAVLLALLATLGLCGCVGSDVIGGADAVTSIYVTEEAPAVSSDEIWIEDAEEPEWDQSADDESAVSVQEYYLDEEGWYYSAEDVSAYLCTYGYLPGNFITKADARALGWEGGSVERYAPGCAIGGDVFGNREGLLPDDGERTYYECDIDTDGLDSRGAKRLVFSDDGLIYYTEDHYESFTLLYGED